MRAKKVSAALAAVLAGAVLLLVLLTVHIDPAFLSAESGWYGYGGTSITPEASSPGGGCDGSYLGVSERNNSIAPSAGGPIHYGSGVFLYRADGISAPAKGFSFSLHPTYNNNHENGISSPTDSNINLTTGYNWHAGIFQLVDGGSYRLRLVGRGDTSTLYGPLSSGVYPGKLGADGKILPTAGDEFTLYATNGTTVRFHDFDGYHGAKFGALKQIRDAAGNTLTAAYIGDEAPSYKGLLDYLTDSAGNKWDFQYTTVADHKRLANVVLTKVVGQSTIELGRCVYTYYDANSGNFMAGSGLNGDLMQIVVTEYDSNGDPLTRTTLFRYWTGAYGDHGAAHKLQYIVGPEGYKALDGAVDVPLKDASDNLVGEYADVYLEYDSASRVTKVSRRGAGCSCSSGLGTYQYAYSAQNSSWNSSSAFSIWRHRVTQTNPDGSVRMVDVNGAGTAINDVLKDKDYAQNGRRWITHHDFDAAGRVTKVYHPNTLSGYNESSHEFTPHAYTGLVDLFAYDASGNLTHRRYKVGSTSQDVNAYWIEYRTYTSGSSGNSTVYVPETITRYPGSVTSDSGGYTTSFAYTWYPNSVLLQQKVVTHPDVGEPQHGGGDTNDFRAYYYNSSGQLQWERDEAGRLTYRQYGEERTGDGEEYYAGLGRLTNAIVDVDAGTRGLDLPDLQLLPYNLWWVTPSEPGDLQTTHSYDPDGRLTETVDPEGKTERRYCTQLSDGSPIVAVYPHVDDTSQETQGPVSLRVFDKQGRVVTAALGAPDTVDANLANDFVAAGTLEGAFERDLLRRTEYVYQNGQKVEEREWTNPESGSAEKYVTMFGYDSMGRLVRVEDAVGEVKRTTYTSAGRVRSHWVGTDDSGWDFDVDSPPTGSGNMTKVVQSSYDGEEDLIYAAGDGNVTRVERFVDGASTRVVDHGYDWRNNRTSSDGEESFYEKLEYDNLNRVTATYRYSGTESAANLRSKTETKYDSRGRVWQTVAWEVNPSNGNLGASLATDHWYDARGHQVKMRSPSGLFSKSAFDGAGRLVKTFVSYDTGETGYSAADDVDGDTVLSQGEYLLDDAGNVLLETRFERHSTGNDTGDRYYVASWYDALHRLEDVADYGTNGGTAVTWSPDRPSRGGSALVTSYGYNDHGLLEDTTDPEGRVSRRDYDALGRVTSVVDDLNGLARTVGTEYDGVGQVSIRRTWMAGGSAAVEETEYVYGVVIGSLPDSKISSKHLLKMIKYSDPTSGSPSSSADEQESFAYNAQGDLIYRTDQNGTVHEFDYDELGRQRKDAATVLGVDVDGVGGGPDVDGWVRRIEASYDALDRVTSVRSYDAVTAGNVKNEVATVYNGFGQVVRSWQAHAGEVNDDTELGADSLSVQYTYSGALGGDPVSRLTGIIYPDSGRTVYFHYNDPQGAATDANWVLVRPRAVSNNSSPDADRVADYTYQGLSRVKTRTAQEPTTDVSVQYGHDGFGRVSSITATRSTAFNDFDYGHNPDSTVKWRAESATGASAKDERYTYDGLGRLDIFQRGNLVSGEISGQAARSQDWALDRVGNWTGLAEDGGDAVSRTHNRSNEITAIGGQGGDAPLYDKSGNALAVMQPQVKGFRYDAWNRVRKVLHNNEEGSVLCQYEYDGLHRRIKAGFSSHNVYYYHSEWWQVLAERDGPTENDKTLREYVWGLQYIDEILARDEDKTEDGFTRDDQDDETLVYVQDANWNVQTLCGESGAPVERYVYDPYGAPTFLTENWGARSEAVYGNRVLFTGRWWDGALLSQTYHYRHREYSPYLGRFLQRDPLGPWFDSSNAGNGYAFAGHDPVVKRDPWGLAVAPPKRTPNPNELPSKPRNCEVYVIWGHRGDVGLAAFAPSAAPDKCCWAQGILGCHAAQPSVCPIGRGKDARESTFPDVSGGAIGRSSEIVEKGSGSPGGNGRHNPAETDDAHWTKLSGSSDAEKIWKWTAIGFHKLLDSAWQAAETEAGRICGECECCPTVKVAFYCVSEDRGSVTLEKRTEDLEGGKSGSVWLPGKGGLEEVRRPQFWGCDLKTYKDCTPYRPAMSGSAGAESAGAGL